MSVEMENVLEQWAFVGRLRRGAHSNDHGIMQSRSSSVFSYRNDQVDLAQAPARVVLERQNPSLALGPGATEVVRYKERDPLKNEKVYQPARKLRIAIYTWRNSGGPW